jgi:hypothetical protein
MGEFNVIPVGKTILALNEGISAKLICRCVAYWICLVFRKTVMYTENFDTWGKKYMKAGYYDNFETICSPGSELMTTNVFTINGL